MSPEEKPDPNDPGDINDPTSIAYANQAELNRVTQMAEEARKEGERIDAENEKRARDFAAQFGVVMDQYASDHRTVVEENNQAAHEAIQALRAGEPLQDGELPEAPELPEDPDFPKPTPLVTAETLRMHSPDPDSE
jgi:hypothetical protein